MATLGGRVVSASILAADGDWHELPGAVTLAFAAGSATGLAGTAALEDETRVLTQSFADFTVTASVVAIDLPPQDPTEEPTMTYPCTPRSLIASTDEPPPNTHGRLIALHPCQHCGHALGAHVVMGEIAGSCGICEALAALDHTGQVLATAISLFARVASYGGGTPRPPRCPVCQAELCTDECELAPILWWPTVSRPDIPVRIV